MPTRAKGRNRRRKRGTAGNAVPSTPAPHDAVVRPPKRERTFEINPVGPLSRLYAWTIDIGLIALAAFAYDNSSGDKFFSNDYVPVKILLPLAYFILPTGMWGRTVGKWVAGIVVVDEEGRTPGVAVSIPREVVGKVVSYAAFGLGMVSIVLHPKRRGWHDSIAGTYVVHDPGAGAPIFGKIWRKLSK